MNKLTGKGFLIWKLENLLPVSRIISALKRADCDWVCIKVANGILKSNTGGDIGGDQGLKAIIDELKAAGFRVGGWHFIFTSNVCKPGLQAALLGERVQKLGIDFVMIDAEEVGSVGALWKSGASRYADAKTFTDQLRGAGVTLKMPAMLCSYRYPFLHIDFPWSAFLKHESINGIAQQLYWVGYNSLIQSINAGLVIDVIDPNDVPIGAGEHAINDSNVAAMFSTTIGGPREQLIESMDQYDDWRNLYENVVPIGAAFGEHGWETTPAQITEFVNAVDEFNLDGCGFWSLDEAISRPEWLDAIANGNTEPSPEPPPEPPIEEKVPMEEWAVYIDEWARTQGYDGPRPDVDVDLSYEVQVNTPNSTLLVRKDKSGTIVDRLPDKTIVTVYPPTFIVDGYTRGEIDYVGSNRWIALEYTIKL